VGSFNADSHFAGGDSGDEIIRSTAARLEIALLPWKSQTMTVFGSAPPTPHFP